MKTAQSIRIPFGQQSQGQQLKEMKSKLDSIYRTMNMKQRFVRWLVGLNMRKVNILMIEYRV